MTSIDKLLQRVSTYTSIYLYNKTIINPYTLASNGLIISNQSPSNKLQSHEEVAICEHQGCSLSITFDSCEQMQANKDPLQLEIRDHDEQCPHKMDNGSNLLTFNYFAKYGCELYQENFNNLQKHQKYIQLSPVEIVKALELKSQEIDQLNLILEMFKKLDYNLQNKEIMKVKSLPFLAVFGWTFSTSHQHELYCKFCGTSVNIFKFISPSECTLMSVSVGFPFISAHRPWCCLIEQYQNRWKQILKQTVIDRLSHMQGKINKTALQIKTKDIKDKAIEIYMSGHPKLLFYRKRMQQFRNQVEERYREDNPRNIRVKETYEQHLKNLTLILDDGNEQLQTFVKKIKID